MLVFTILIINIVSASAGIPPSINNAGSFNKNNEYFYSPNNFKTMEPQENSYQNFFNNEEISDYFDGKTTASEASARFLNQGVQDQLTSVEYFYSPRNYKAVQPRSNSPQMFFNIKPKEKVNVWNEENASILNQDPEDQSTSAEYFYSPRNYKPVQPQDNLSPKFTNIEEKDMKEETMMSKKNAKVLNENSDGQSTSVEYFYSPSKYKAMQPQSNSSLKLNNIEEKNMQKETTSERNTRTLTQDPDGQKTSAEYFYSPSNYKAVQPQDKSSPQYFNIEKETMASEKNAKFLKQYADGQSTSAEYFYSPSNYKAVQPQGNPFRKNSNIEETNFEKETMTSEENASILNQDGDSQSRSVEYFYSPNYKAMQPPTNSSHNLLNIKENNIKGKLMTRETLARILNQGVQDALVAGQTETFKHSLSLQGSNVLKQVAEAIISLWYQPVMVLLDNTKEVHHEAGLFMRNLLRISQINAEFRLMKFNSSDVSPVLANTSINKQNFLNYFKWIENTNPMETSTVIAPAAVQKGAAFYAILKAIEILPPDSGIIVFTDRQVEDEDLSQLAIKELLQKNITLYIIWEGIYPTSKNEEKLLRETAHLSGGDFFVGNTERKLSELYSSFYGLNDEAKQAKDVIAFYTNITGMEQHNFPIDSSVMSIHIGITSRVVSAKLTSPNGFVINILNNTEIEHFSKGSFSTYETRLDQYEIQLNTAGYVPTPIVGIWRLDVDASGLYTRGCNIIVSVQTHLNVTTSIVYTFHEEIVENPAPVSPKVKRVLRVVVSDEIKEIDRIALLDKKGLPIIPNLAFTLPYKNKEPLTDVEGIPKPLQKADIDFQKLPSGPFYLRILGKDKNERAFSRLSYYDTAKLNYLMQPLTISVGAGSELLVQPRQYGKIFFEVTNNRDQVMFLQFMVQDERSHLSRMEPRSSWVNPKQTLTVTVTTYTSGPPGGNYRNLVTFTVFGPEKVEKSAAMYVTTNKVIDDEDPRMWHRYTSDCTDIILGNCAHSSWVIEVTAEDRESGLLLLSSSPKGLYFPNGYVSGTKEPIVGLYGGSCCQPKLTLTAIDLQNNRVSYTADAYKAALNAGSIAAIVLGVLLFIIILILLIYICRRTCCKKKDSVDLPTYRGPHGSPRRY